MNSRILLRTVGGAAIAVMLMGASCPFPPTSDFPEEFENECYPQQPDPLTGLCPEPGRDAPESAASEPADTPEPAAAPSAPSPEPSPDQSPNETYDRTDRT